MPKTRKDTKQRSYDGRQRAEAAAETRDSVLESAKALFSRKGLDAVTIAEIAQKAGVSAPTVYALFKSKEGILLALMKQTLFGERYRAAVSKLAAIDDPTEQIAMTSSIARIIYEGERGQLGPMRSVSAFSPALRKIEQKFEDARFSLQEARLKRLYSEGKAKKGLAFEAARRLLWMYTSRDVYRMLVQEGGWTADQYEEWLSATLMTTLVERPR